MTDLYVRQAGLHQVFFTKNSEEIRIFCDRTIKEMILRNSIYTTKLSTIKTAAVAKGGIATAGKGIASGFNKIVGKVKPKPTKSNVADDADITVKEPLKSDE